MKINLKFFIYLPILFFFTPGFSFCLPGTKVIFTVFNVSLYFALAIMFYLDGFNLIKRFFVICKKTPLFYYLIFMILSALTTIFASAMGILPISRAILNILHRYVLIIIPVFVYFIGLLTKHLSLKQFFRIFIMGLWINTIFGIIAYIARLFDISIINYIFDFFNNSRYLSSSLNGEVMGTAELIFAERKRLCGLYNEPGYLGRFLFLFLPFVYSFSDAKIKVFKNKLFDILLKRTLVFLTWVNLILTLSPINLVFGVIITFIYYFTSIIYLIKKYFIVLLSSLIIIAMIIFNINIDVSETYIMRILNVIFSIKSFDKLVLIEPSLATRLDYDINSFLIFIKHPFIGIGINNIPYLIYQQCLQSPIPLTQEVIFNLRTQVFSSKITTTPVPCFYSALTETGILIASIFFYMTKKLLSNIFDFFKHNSTTTFEYLLAKSLFYSLICCLIEYFYEVTFTLIQFNLILSLSFVTIYFYKKKIILEKTLDKKENIL